MVFLATWCIFIGLAPTLVLRRVDAVAELLLGEGLGEKLGSGWLFLTPISAERASYSPALFMGVVGGVVFATYLFVRLRYRTRTRRGPAWDCGFPAQTPRMQDTAEGFGQPVKQIFEPFFRIERVMPEPFDPAPRYWSRTGDRLWHALYLPIGRAVERISTLIARLQHGRIQWYLVYSFVTLLALLVVIRL